MIRGSRAWLVWALGLAILGSSMLASAPAQGFSSGNRPAKAVTITLHGSVAAPAGWGWASTNISNPGPLLTVQQGDVITFQLFSRDSPAAHELVIDLNNNQAKDAGDRNSTAFTNATVTTNFVFTASTAGNFNYFCAIHGFAAQHGTLTVQGPSGGDNTLLIVGGIVAVLVIVAAVVVIMMRRKAKPPTQPSGP